MHKHVALTRKHRHRLVHPGVGEKLEELFPRGQLGHRHRSDAEGLRAAETASRGMAPAVATLPIYQTFMEDEIMCDQQAVLLTNGLRREV